MEIRYNLFIHAHTNFLFHIFFQVFFFCHKIKVFIFILQFNNETFEQVAAVVFKTFLQIFQTYMEKVAINMRNLIKCAFKTINKNIKAVCKWQLNEKNEQTIILYRLINGQISVMDYFGLVQGIQNLLEKNFYVNLNWYSQDFYFCFVFQY